MEPKLLFSPSVCGIKAGNARTPQPLGFNLCQGTPSSSSRSFATGPTSARDNLIKVTFQAFHDSSADGTMHVTGSLPSLGAWDAKRARKMTRAGDGSWILAVYIPERAEFLYQYLLLKDSPDISKDPVVLWEGALERKCKLDDASATPNKQFFLSDDARGEISSPMPQALSYSKSDCAPPNSQSFKEEEKVQMQEEINMLVLERNRCQNELIKLKVLTPAS